MVWVRSRQARDKAAKHKQGALTPRPVGSMQRIPGHTPSSRSSVIVGLGEEGWVQRQGPHGYHQQQHQQYQQHSSSHYRRRNDDRLTHASYQISPAPPPDAPTWRQYPHHHHQIPQQFLHEESPLEETPDLGFDLAEFEERLAQPSAMLMARMEASRLEAKAREQDVGRLEIEEIFSDINHITEMAGLNPSPEKRELEEKVFRENEASLEPRAPLDPTNLSHESQRLEQHQQECLQEPGLNLSEDMRSSGINLASVEAHDQKEAESIQSACERQYTKAEEETVDVYGEDEDDKSNVLEEGASNFGRQLSVDSQEDRVNIFRLFPIMQTLESNYVHL